MNSNYKILVVDDEFPVVEIVCDILTDEGYEVLSAFSGANAYEVAKKEIPNLILLDWEMPEMNGIELLNQLKDNDLTSRIPVIMITGRMNNPSDLKMAFDAGAIDFIHKPIEPIELIARTSSMILLDKYYKDSVRKKDWELALLAKTNNQVSTLLSDLSVFIEDIPSAITSESKYLKELNRKVKSHKANINNTSWEQFQEYFLNIHPNFQQNLSKRFPNLTNEELKLSYFLRLNMNSKEIAAITNKETHSIDIGRYRLRKKFKLERNISLHSFLSQF